MNRFIHFFQYHNAVPIALGVLFIGAGGAFAATNPEAIYSKTEETVAIDNTYIAQKDLSAFSPKVEIVGVTEDSDNYYVAYKLSTIDLKDAVWQDIVKEETMNVSKPDLGPYRDLGVYVTGQLRQIVGRESQRLAETQEIEKKSVSQKVVATIYGGLVGKFLDEKTEVLPGYTPVVIPPERQDNSQVASAAVGANTTESAGPSLTSSAHSSDNPSLVIQILGNNPAQIPRGSSYVDLGAVTTDAQNDNLGIHTFLNGVEMQQIQIDTSTTSVSTITYKVTDPRGASVSASRKVYVYDPALGPPIPDSQVQHGSAAPLPVPEPTPAPEPTPPPQESPPATTPPDTTPIATTTPEPAPEPSPDTSTTTDSTSPPADTTTTDTATTTNTTSSTTTTP